MEGSAAPAGDRSNVSLRRFAPRVLRRHESVDDAFEGFYRTHVAEVYQYALAVLGNSADAEDVTQQTFLNAYRAFQHGGRPIKPHNWLIKIAHNVCRMRWRQSGRRLEEVPLESVPEPAAPDEDKPSLDEVLAALARLPFNQRAAIVMREAEDRSYAEIAEVLGVTVPAVEALLFRARGNLRAWRKAVAGLTAQVGEHPAKIVDVSYGGVRFEITPRDGTLPPDRFQLRLPNSMSLQADLVWKSMLTNEMWVCGAAVWPEESSARQWFGLVDTAT